MRIFISYAARDEGLASQLADQLSRAGFSVWDAAKEIAPGDNWAKETGRALDESDVMVAVITPRCAAIAVFAGGYSVRPYLEAICSIGLFPFLSVTRRSRPARTSRGFY